MAQEDDERNDEERNDEDRSLQSFWHWFALGVLVFCWIAEASMCAERGF